MNLLLVEGNEVSTEGVVELGGRRARHLVQVLGVKLGDRVRVGIINGGWGEGRVEGLPAPDRVHLRVVCQGVPHPPSVDLILAVPRPKVLSRILQDLATLGVRRLALVNAWRVDKSYLKSKRLDPERIRADLLLGCEQGRTTWLPEVQVEPQLVPYLRDRLAPWLEREAPRCLIAHPAAGQLLEQVLAPGDPARVVVALGPEGGWIEREIDSFSALGFTPVRLGAEILRSETAVACLLAQVKLLRRLRMSEPTLRHGLTGTEAGS